MDWILTCDRYFDGESFVDQPARVEIADGRIESVHVQPNTNGDPPDDASASHAHAPSLIPGLIDGHAHVVGYASGPMAGNPFELEENHLRLLICNGVTTARDAGNSLERVEYLHWWIKRNDGPDIIPTSPVLSTPPLEWPFTHITETPEAARRAVQRLDRGNVSTVALHHRLTPDVARAIIEEARRHDLYTAADVKHVSADRLLEAGVDCIECVANLCSPDHPGSPTASVAGEMRRWSHLDLASDRVARLIDRLAAEEVFVTTSLLNTERWCSVEAMIEEPHLEYMTTVMPRAEKMIEMRQPMGMMMGKKPFRESLNIPNLSGEAEAEMEEGLDTLRRFTHRLAEAGVPLVVGTDTPKPSIVPGFSVHQEVELLVNCGLSRADALRAATTEPAALLRDQEETDDRRGAIREGARADLLLVDGDPSVDITATRNIKAVFKDGRKVDRQDLFAPIQSKVDAI